MSRKAPLSGPREANLQCVILLQHEIVEASRALHVVKGMSDRLGSGEDVGDKYIEAVQDALNKCFVALYHPVLLPDDAGQAVHMSVCPERLYFAMRPKKNKEPTNAD